MSNETQKSIIVPDFEKAEHTRLVDEIQKDRELQFRIFWQALTITAVMFSISVNIMDSEIGLNFPFLLLAPHLILVPSTAIILNRARTANRKNGYILTVFDQVSDFSNWEKDLSRLRGEIPHRPATLKSMLLTVTTFEIVCLLLFFAFLFALSKNTTAFYGDILPFISCVYLIIYSLLISKRFRSYFCIRYETSIQGYATQWAKTLGLNVENDPNFPTWNVEIWKDTRNNELKFRPRSPKTNKKKINFGFFIWKVIYKNPNSQGKSEKALAQSIRKPIIFAVLIWMFLTVICELLQINELILNSFK